MDIETMHIAVKLELDKTSALELPSFEPEEIDFWLNTGIRKFVKGRYSGVNAKRQSFEETQKRIEDLKPLVINAEVDVTTSNTYVNQQGYKIDGFLPTDQWFTLLEQVLIIIDTAEIRTGVTQCTHDELPQKLDDPYSEHILHYNTAKPLRLISNNTVEFITDGNYSVSLYLLTYLRKPTTVVLSSGIDCDLPEHTHDEIVKLTVQMMLESIEQPRYNTYSNEVANME